MLQGPTRRCPPGSRCSRHRAPPRSSTGCPSSGRWSSATSCSAPARSRARRTDPLRLCPEHWLGTGTHAELRESLARSWTSPSSACSSRTDGPSSSRAARAGPGSRSPVDAEPRRCDPRRCVAGGRQRATGGRRPCASCGAIAPSAGRSWPGVVPRGGVRLARGAERRRLRGRRAEAVGLVLSPGWCRARSSLPSSRRRRPLSPRAHPPRGSSGSSGACLVAAAALALDAAPVVVYVSAVLAACRWPPTGRATWRWCRCSRGRPRARCFECGRALARVDRRVEPGRCGRGAARRVGPGRGLRDVRRDPLLSFAAIAGIRAGSPPAVVVTGLESWRSRARVRGAPATARCGSSSTLRRPSVRARSARRAGRRPRNRLARDREPGVGTLMAAFGAGGVAGALAGISLVGRGGLGGPFSSRSPLGGCRSH